MASYNGPMIGFHGGLCCGIKVIHGLGLYPNQMADPIEIEKREDRVQNADQWGRHVSSEFNFFNGNAPQEKWSERIDRYIKYLDTVRPNGIIEIVLADDECPGAGGECQSDYDGECHCHEDDQTPIWRPFIEERGFVEVANCHNSNSGNRIFIFHRKKDK